MNLYAFAKLWSCEAEFTPAPDTDTYVHVWEPLRVDAPADAKPYCYGIGQVTFFKPYGTTAIAWDVRFHCMNHGCADLILLNDNVWRECGFTEIVYRDGRWYAKHTARSNTRAARMMNAGMVEYQK